MKRVRNLLVIVAFFSWCFSFALIAQTVVPTDEQAVVTEPAATEKVVSREDLAKESEEACAACAKDAATAEMVIKKVEEACKLVEAEGRKSFPKFMGKDSSFIFAGTYIWIHDLEGVMQMHPLKHKLEGNPLLIFKDKNGKRFFVEMNKVAEEKGAGWVDYYWPIPGSKEVGRKVSYVKLCKSPENEKFVVGCGIYGLSDEEIEKLVSSK